MKTSYGRTSQRGHPSGQTEVHPTKRAISTADCGWICPNTHKRVQYTKIKILQSVANKNKKFFIIQHKFIK